MSTPGISADGDRYLVGLNDAASLSGSFASLTNDNYVGNLVGGYIAEYKSSISNWVTTLPTDGMTLRVNDQDDSFYRYEGTYSTGQWYKERVNQVRYLNAVSSNGVDYTITTGDYFTYSTEVVYLVQFGTANSGSNATLNINGLGQKSMKKQVSIGLSDFTKADINSSNIYNLIYDGTYFRVNKQASDGGFSLKYKIVTDERIEVPAYSEYLLYGDLEVNGILDINSTGKVVLINGGLNVNGGTVSNSGNIQMINLATTNMLPQHYIGEEFGGGVIFHLWKDSLGVEHGLILNKTDIDFTYDIWSNINNVEIGLSAQSPWNGPSNSNAIISQIGHTGSAAKICLDLVSDGYSDWYLPSIQELNMLWNNYYTVSKSLSEISGATLLNSGQNVYWSSSEKNDNWAFAFTFTNGYAVSADKASTGMYLRAIRQF
jgi:hypothetical protein